MRGGLAGPPWTYENAGAAETLSDAWQLLVARGRSLRRKYRRDIAQTNERAGLLFLPGNGIQNSQQGALADLVEFFSLRLVSAACVRITGHL
jgi:hypothetical protein